MSIRLEHVNKYFAATHVVRDVSLEVQVGELFVLLGASGSGKSTLLRLIAGLLPADTGHIYLNEDEVTHVSPQKRGIGFVFQNYSLFRHMTVAQNIDFGLSIRGQGKAERAQRVQELLELIDLPGYGERVPSQLSGGQQQRVALARALAYEPKVLLLDEPFGALDVKIRAQLRQSLREIQQRLGLTAILVTHDQEEAFDIADRIGVMNHGEVLEVGSPTELYQRPKHMYTATFLGTANVLPARRNGSLVHVGDLNLPAPPHTDHLANQAVNLLARPEELLLYSTREQAKETLIGSASVETISFAGHLLRVGVKLQDADARLLTVSMSPADARDLGLENGQQVWVGVREYHLLPG
ncbi:MAG: ATP-binding cassette domain-containing protein [Pleurocapsa minor GSE-CHR-MK-17-07R]|jgi:sulfate transport system ATP-binding protein|nr:ATP-binding cassette domain-containing protein [Pleurocapsa minor GSE-CHR-MK 17-07R]